MIAEDVEMQLRSRRPAASSARPEIDFNDITASESQWYWARVRPVLALRNGYRLTRKQAGGQPFDTDNSGESIFLYIIQNDVFGEVQHLLLTDVDRGL